MFTTGQWWSGFFFGIAFWAALTGTINIVRMLKVLKKVRSTKNVRPLHTSDNG